MKEEGTKNLPDLQALLEAKDWEEHWLWKIRLSSFLFFDLLSPLASSVMCSLVLLPRVCSFSFVTVFSGSYAFLCFFEKKQGNNSPAFGLILLGCSLVLSVCLFPGLSSFSNGFFRVFSSGFFCSFILCLLVFSPFLLFFSVLSSDGLACVAGGEQLADQHLHFPCTSLAF
jgi:hypothetical protein